MKAEHEPVIEGWAWAWAARVYHYRRGDTALCTRHKVRAWYPVRSLVPGDPRRCPKCEAKLAAERET